MAAAERAAKQEAKDKGTKNKGRGAGTAAERDELLVYVPEPASLAARVSRDTVQPRAVHVPPVQLFAWPEPSVHTQ